MYHIIDPKNSTDKKKKAATYNKNNLVNLKALFVYSDDFLLYTDTVYTNNLE